MSRRIWTKAEKEFLCKNYGILSATKIGNVLRRKNTSIKQMANKMGLHCSSRETICWKCKKATGLCSWSHKFKPVKGWKATETELPNYYGGIRKIATSYIVHKCPEFVAD